LTQQLDIAANRRANKYSRHEMLLRLLWQVGAVLFRLTPRTAFATRRLLLRAFGARVGRAVNIYNSAVIYMPWNLEIGDWSCIGELAYIYNLGPIRLGERVTVSHRAHLCAGTHDYNLPELPLLKPPIVIGDQVWICTDAFVGPGVSVGEGAVVGARAVVTQDVTAWSVVAGNPAVPVKQRILRNPS
jgi:putative colanic acid biosynthesis acetyltransferase WcaF